MISRSTFSFFFIFFTKIHSKHFFYIDAGAFAPGVNAYGSNILPAPASGRNVLLLLDQGSAQQIINDLVIIHRTRIVVTFAAGWRADSSAIPQVKVITTSY